MTFYRWATVVSGVSHPQKEKPKNARHPGASPGRRVHGCVRGASALCLWVLSLLGCHSWWALLALFLWVACGSPGRPWLPPLKAEALRGGQRESSQALANLHLRPLGIPSEGALLWGLSLTLAFPGQTFFPRLSRLCSGCSLRCWCQHCATRAWLCWLQRALWGRGCAKNSGQAGTGRHTQHPYLECTPWC